MDQPRYRRGEIQERANRRRKRTAAFVRASLVNDAGFDDLRQLGHDATDADGRQIVVFERGDFRRFLDGVSALVFDLTFHAILHSIVTNKGHDGLHPLDDR